jgi:hypothetical protein
VPVSIGSITEQVFPDALARAALFHLLSSTDRRKPASHRTFSNSTGVGSLSISTRPTRRVWTRKLSADLSRPLSNANIISAPQEVNTITFRPAGWYSFQPFILVQNYTGTESSDQSYTPWCRSVLSDAQKGRPDLRRQYVRNVTDILSQTGDK